MLFKNFCDLVSEMIKGCSFVEKLCTISKVFTKNNATTITKSDLKLFCKLLFWDLDSKKFYVSSDQLLKIFARLFSIDQTEILKDIEIINLSDSISFYFTQNKKCKPANTNTLTLSEIDEFLNKLCDTKMDEEDHVRHFEVILDKCTVDELRILVHLIQHDLNMNNYVRHILEVIHLDAHQLFEGTKTFDAVIDKYINISSKFQKEFYLM